jgi:hypothetical protein
MAVSSGSSISSASSWRIRVMKSSLTRLVSCTLRSSESEESMMTFDEWDALSVVVYLLSSSVSCRGAGVGVVGEAWRATPRDDTGVAE